MIDGCGRTIDYLRISVTDRCNLRCRYCMPQGAVSSVPRGEVLTLEEIARVAIVMARMGLRKVRLTGGEPLVRRNVTVLLRQLHETEGIRELALTTNGVLLKPLLPELTDCGLNAVNISLDTLDADVYRRITGSDALKAVLEGLYAAYDRGLRVKLNCVPCRELNPGAPLRLAGIARERAIDVRFIELMPIGQGRLFTGVPSEEILDQLSRAFGAARPLPYRGEGPARYYAFDGFQGRIGFISPMTHRFCADCNRLRLTSEGWLKLCLYYRDGIDLRTLLRSGASDAELTQAIAKALANKPRQHGFGQGDAPATERHRMNEIGG